MILVRTVILTLLAVALASDAVANQQDRVSVDGFKGVRIGMTVADASKAYGSSLTPVAPVPEDARFCYYIFPGGAIGPASFMVVDERVVRIDVTGRGFLTAAGIGVGSLESEVHEAYAGRVTVSVHPYLEPQEHYLMVEPQHGFAMIFETDGTKVTSYRAGKIAQVRWIEGCS